MPNHPQIDGSAHFAFIISENKIIEWATNRQSEPIKEFGYPDYSMRHAEFEAFRKSRGIINKKKPFYCINIRLNKKGELKLSKPCTACYNYLKSFGCNKVYYSSEIGFLSID